MVFIIYQKFGLLVVVVIVMVVVMFAEFCF